MSPLWHPHTDTPAEPGTVALIAVMDVGVDPYIYLKDGMWKWFCGKWMRHNLRFDIVLADPVYWWCAESDLIDILFARHAPEAA